MDMLDDVVVTEDEREREIRDWSRAIIELGVASGDSEESILKVLSSKLNVNKEKAKLYYQRYKA